jgi:hypothetical protein
LLSAQLPWLKDSGVSAAKTQREFPGGLFGQLPPGSTVRLATFRSARSLLISILHPGKAAFFLENRKFFLASRHGETVEEATVGRKIF